MSNALPTAATLEVNLWGFERIQTGPDKGSYYHPLFIKGRRECCQRLTRVRLKGPPSSDTKQTNGHSGITSADHDKKLPAMMPGGGVTVPVAVGLQSTGSIAAVAPSVGVGTVAPPIHGFTRPNSSHVSAIEATLRGSSQQQIADLLRFQQEGQHRETLAAAAAGLGPEMASLLAPSAPLYASTDRSALVVNGLQQHQREVAAQQQQHGEEQRESTQSEPQGQQLKEGPVLHEVKRPPVPVACPDQLPPASHQNGHDQTTGTSTRSDEMAALLAVSAQRRREEELALLLELSKPKGVDV